MSFTQDGLYEMVYRTVNEDGSGGVRLDGGNRTHVRWENGHQKVYCSDPGRPEPNQLDLTADEANIMASNGHVLRFVKAMKIPDDPAKRWSVELPITATIEEDVDTDDDDTEVTPDDVLAAVTSGEASPSEAAESVNELFEVDPDDAAPYVSLLVARLSPKRAIQFVSALDHSKLLEVATEQESRRVTPSSKGEPKPRRSVLDAIDERTEELAEGD